MLTGISLGDAGGISGRGYVGADPVALRSCLYLVFRTAEMIMLGVSLCVKGMQTFVNYLGLQIYQRGLVDSRTIGEDMAGLPNQSMNTHCSTRSKGSFEGNWY
jgi:hypothetical protein